MQQLALWCSRAAFTAWFWHTNKVCCSMPVQNYKRSYEHTYTHAHKWMYLHVFRIFNFCVSAFAYAPHFLRLWSWSWPACVFVCRDWPPFTNLLALPESRFSSQRKLPVRKILLHFHTVGGQSTGSQVSTRKQASETWNTTSRRLQSPGVFSLFNMVKVSAN